MLEDKMKQFLVVSNKMIDLEKNLRLRLYTAPQRRREVSKSARQTLLINSFIREGNATIKDITASVFASQCAIKEGFNFKFKDFKLENNIEFDNPELNDFALIEKIREVYNEWYSLLQAISANIIYINEKIKTSEKALEQKQISIKTKNNYKEIVTGLKKYYRPYIVSFSKIITARCNAEKAMGIELGEIEYVSDKSHDDTIVEFIDKHRF